MTTAITLINDAAGLAEVKQDGVTLSGNESALFLRSLNNMLSSWRNDGVDLNLSTLALNDTIYVDSADIEGLKYNLAIRIANDSYVPLRPHIEAMAAKLFSALESKYYVVDEVETPPALRNRRNVFDIDSI